MIIGLVGTVCSGKDTASQILQQKGFEVMSFGDVLREEMRRAGLPTGREAMQNYGNNLREKEGADAISRKIITKIRPGKNYVVQGFRNPKELVPFLKRIDFTLIVIDASIETRFTRMLERKRERDPTTFEEFLELDKKEQGKGQHQEGLRIADCIEMANYSIKNEGDVENLRKLILELIEKIKK